MRLTILALLLACSAAIAAEEHPATLAIGAAAPNFNLPAVDGKNYSLQDFDSSQVLVVVFTCVHCPTAQLYENRIRKLAADYRDRGVALVAIQPNNPKSVRLDEMGYTDLSDSLPEMKIRAAYRHFNFPFLYDGETQAVARAYGPTATPHVFVFDRQRKLRCGAVHAGKDDDQHLARIKVGQPVVFPVDGRQVEIGRGRADRQSGGMLFRVHHARTSYQKGQNRESHFLLNRVNLCLSKAAKPGSKRASGTGSPAIGSIGTTPAQTGSA